MKKLTEIRKFGTAWWRLREENKELRKLLGAKRYKMIDLVVDSAYKFIRPPFLNKRQDEPNTRKYQKRVQSKQVFDEKRVDIINYNFFDWSGKVLYRGGAERYVYDLAKLLQGMGYNPRILQCAKKGFQKTYDEIPVIGVEVPNHDVRQISAIYQRVCQGARLIISSPSELVCAMDNMKAPIITINHGINFDLYKNTYKNTIYWSYMEYMEALVNCSQCVCVDTNYINWIRTKDNSLSLKARYVPNYFNSDVFKPTKKTNNKLVCVFPRRIYEARGSDITVRAFDKLLPKYKDKLELRLVGQIDNKTARSEVNMLLKKYPQNVSHVVYDMDDMTKAYKDADVVLIPTKCSEGTSLSCIEGMASGTAVIASNVGGLANLIIDQYNGLLISPTAEDLETAIETLLHNPQLIDKLSKNAIQVAQASFTKELWERRWKKIINNVLADSKGTS